MKLKNNVSFESVIRSFEELYNRSYNSLELAELKLCYDNQLPLDKFARLQAHWRMRQARLGLEAGIDLFQHSKECYNYKQLKATRQIAVMGLILSVERMKQLNLPALLEIRKGLENGVDVSIYAKPEFNWQQMRQILEGLKSNVDVSIYADPNFTWLQMRQIRLGLESGIDASRYARTDIDYRNMEELRYELEEQKEASY